MAKRTRFICVVALAGLIAAFAVFAASVDELRAKAEAGDAGAQLELGSAYDRGQGVPKDVAQAAAWYRKAAEQGNAVAQNSLGSLYQYGEGVSQNPAEAAQWYQKAADQGYGEAFTNLGYLYDEGLGVKQDKTKAVKLYESGAERGSLNAVFNLGMSYQHGEGVEADPVRAYMWFDLARFYTQRSPDMKLKWRVRKLLDETKRGMTKDQIARAEALAREWDQQHRK